MRDARAVVSPDRYGRAGAMTGALTGKSGVAIRERDALFAALGLRAARLRSAEHTSEIERHVFPQRSLMARKILDMLRYTQVYIESRNGV